MPSEPKNAPDLSPAVVRDETNSTSGVTFSGLSTEPSATLQLRLDMEHYQRTGDARYLDASGREIRFLAASDPWARDSATPARVRDDRQDDRSIMSIDAAVEITSDMDVDPLTIDECSAIDTLEFYARLYQSQQSALDALAVAVKPIERVAWNAGAGAVDDTYAVTFQARDLRPLLSAITALLDGRTTDA